MGLRTPLFAWHASGGATIVDFGGWDMPVIYSSIIEEHQATRQGVGLFDISHMGRIRVEGAGAAAFLDRILTNNVADLKLGQIRYSLVLNESAGTLDDVLVYRFPDFYLLVVNASNRVKLLPWFGQQAAGFEVTLTDQTIEWAMVACQGPAAIGVAQNLVEPRLDELRYYFATETTYENAYAIVSRTGYTGEDGVELIVPADKAVGLWTRMLELGKPVGARAIGLGARDTLRLEAGMPLYGHELDETIDPIQAGLGWAVKGKSKDFIGKEALAQREPSRPIRVGLRLADRRIARQGFAIVDPSQANEPIGEVTSGTFAPTLQASIAMGYVAPKFASVGIEVAVMIRDKPVPAAIVPLPFYTREKKT